VLDFYHLVRYIRPMNTIPTPKDWASDTRAQMARKKMSIKTLTGLLGNKSYATVQRWLNGNIESAIDMKRVSEIVEEQ
jgi:N-methylhydantoinase B/oxoprolinase/acetone carboxylase alpha subunit